MPIQKRLAKAPGAVGRGSTWLAAATGIGALALAVALGGSQARAADVRAHARAATPSQITIAVDYLVNSLDPFADADYESSEIDFLWGGNLATFGSPAAGGGRPELAQSLTPADHAKTWKVVLRPGLKFSTGTPITAADVVATFDYAKRNADAGGVSGQSLSFFADFESVKANGTREVTFRFRQPQTQFVQVVALPYFPIMPAAGLAEGKKFWAAPISAGRYEVTSENAVNGSYAFQVNPNYYKAPPQVKTVFVNSVTNAATRLAELKSGQVQYADNLPGNLISQLTGNLHGDPFPWPAGDTELVMNSQKGSITSDVKIRQAINLALNRKQLVQTAMNSAPGVTEMYGIPWNEANTPPDVKPFTQNLAKAKALLQGTACQSGCTVRTAYPTNAGWAYPPIMETVAQQLKQIGITVQPDGITGTQDPFTLKNVDMVVYGYGAFLNSPLTVAIGFVAASKDSVLGSWAKFTNPAMTKIANAMSTASESRLPGLIAKANKLFNRYLPVVPLTSFTYVAGDALPKDVLSSTQGAYLNIK